MSIHFFFNMSMEVIQFSTKKNLPQSKIIKENMCLEGLKLKKCRIVKRSSLKRGKSVTQLHVFTLHSMNIQGLWGQHNKLNLNQFLEMGKPNMPFIHETMGKGDYIVYELKKLYVAWGFLALDSNRLSRGLVTIWNQRWTLINSYSILSNICTKSINKSKGFLITILKVYGPYEDTHGF